MPFVAFIIFLVALNSFVGGLIVRKFNSSDLLTIPYVDLLKSDKDQVLDACCGSGRSTIALAMVIKNGHITAFDRFDADYIDKGGRTLLESNLQKINLLNKVTIVQGDVTEMNFENNTFDAAFSSYAFDHLGNQKLKALQEVNRVLNEKERFLLIVIVPSLQTFFFSSLLSFLIPSSKSWHKLFEKSNFALKDEGVINIGRYFLVEKK